MGGVALIRFPGGLGLLEIVEAGDVFRCFFSSGVFCTSIFTSFCRFWDVFWDKLSSILASFWRSFSDADF